VAYKRPALSLFRTGALLPLLISTAVLSQTPAAAAPTQDARNTDIITVDSHLSLPRFDTLEQWKKRKAFLRNQILVAAGLSPLPQKSPLHTQIFGKIETKDYTIEKVLIETLPGFYLGGNLYRPRNSRLKHPAILNPQGHWPYGRLENEPLYSAPSLGISLARQGYVVFAYDMLGYNDNIQLPHRFGSPEQRLWSFGPLGLQLWNSIRSLDLLESLPDVDTTRLGVTGASGGGTQAFLLAAVDDRLQFAAPVNMVSAIMQGGDLCENAPGLRLNTSNVEIAAMFAPKPMLLVSATGDWTRNVPTQEFPAIRRIYDLYGKGDQVEVVQIHEQHNFNRLSREAVYRFFANHNPPMDTGIPGSSLATSRELSEHDIDVPMLQDMLVLANRTLPAGALDLNSLFLDWQRAAAAQTAQIHDRAFLRDRLRQTLAVEVPHDVIATFGGASQTGRSMILSRPAIRDRIPAIWIDGKGQPAIVIDGNGSTAAIGTDVVRRLREEHRPILLLDVFQTGSARAPRTGDIAIGPMPATDHSDDEAVADAAAGFGRFLTFNVSADAARVQDIVTAISYAERGGQSVDLFATGDAALWATYAAAVNDRPVALHLEAVPALSSNADYVRHFNVSGILRAGGWPVARDLATNPASPAVTPAQ
jgi:dienelactone hydrolase